MARKQDIQKEIKDGRLERRIAASCPLDRIADCLAIVSRDALLVDVRAVDRQRGDERNQGAAQTVECKVPGAAVLLGDAIQRVREHVQLARQRSFHDELLARVHHIGKWFTVARDASAELAKCLCVIRIDEQPVERVHEAVTSGAMHRPVLRKVLSGCQNLLDDDVQGRGAKLAATGLLDGQPERSRRKRLEAVKIRCRCEQAVGVVDPHARHGVSGNQSREQVVRRLEDFRQFHTHACQIVNVEEPPVVDFVRRRPPVRKPVRLPLEELVQQVVAVGHANPAVEGFNRPLDVLAHAC